MFHWFETILRPTAPPPPGQPPDGLAAFYRHFVRQSRALVAALFGVGMLTALVDSLIPAFLGHVVSLVGRYRPGGAVGGGALAAAWAWRRSCWWPGRRGMLLLNLVTNQAIAPGMTNLIRWQSHWHVVRQSWTFFQNDFAGRIANRVMQVGPALRESIVATTNAVWYIVVYGGSAMLLLGRADLVLALPLALWFVCYVAMLRVLVPRARERSRRMSEVRSGLTGRVVDSYTNILTVKLFARASDEDAHVAEAIDEHTAAFQHQVRLITTWVLSLQCLNACMVVGTGALSVCAVDPGRGQRRHGGDGAAARLAGVQHRRLGLAERHRHLRERGRGAGRDALHRRAAAAPRRAGRLRAEGERRRHPVRGVHFGYGTERGVLHGVDLAIRPGERIGVVGQSGAGKSTLVNLLLGFYAPEHGRILIDRQDIAGVTGESLRGQIGMVTQDTSLLHRSIRENIRYGRPQATEAEVLDAARRAHADGFIATLEDWNGRRGYDAHVGERGVKLSGGQRQRVAIARVILKDAPILVLDEATSALDSEVEAAIQEQLDGLMEGRTVIAIAHRLSTLSRMDRIVVLEAGAVVEQGTHAALLAAGGSYARLWQRQSGGFLRAEAPAHALTGS